MSSAMAQMSSRNTTTQVFAPLSESPQHQVARCLSSTSLGPVTSHKILRICYFIC